jgi:predicted nucleic acid-binding protein
MVSNERRGRLTPADTAVFLRTVSRLGIVTDREADGAVIIELARKHRLTAYDAAYLELAQRRAASLATLDDALVRAAKAESVPLVGE